MCEQFLARAAEPFRIDGLWEFAERLERWGVAAYGWGAAWLGSDGSFRTHRDIRAFRDDPGRELVGREETTSLLVHLRRPSKFSTIGIPDTQPFLDPGERFAFCHNGDLADYRVWRERFRAAGRIAGKADSEAGARWLEDHWGDGGPRGAAAALAGLHTAFGGAANLGVLEASGGAHMYAGNDENPVFTFRLGSVGVLSTGMNSVDRSLFRYVCPGATERRLVPLGRTASLARDGAPAA